MEKITRFGLGTLVGAFIALIVVLLMYNNSPVDKKIRAINDMMSECEKNLPRNVTCELVAKPKENVK